VVQIILKYNEHMKTIVEGYSMVNASEKNLRNYSDYHRIKKVLFRDRMTFFCLIASSLKIWGIFVLNNGFNKSIAYTSHRYDYFTLLAEVLRRLQANWTHSMKLQLKKLWKFPRRSNPSLGKWLLGKLLLTENFPLENTKGIAGSCVLESAGTSLC